MWYNVVCKEVSTFSLMQRLDVGILRVRQTTKHLHFPLWSALILKPHSYLEPVMVAFILKNSSSCMSFGQSWTAFILKSNAAFFSGRKRQSALWGLLFWSLFRHQENHKKCGKRFDLLIPDIQLSHTLFFLCFFMVTWSHVFTSFFLCGGKMVLKVCLGA